MTREIRPAPSGFWTDGRGLSIFLAALVAIIIVPALVPVGLAGRLLGDALVSVMLISGAATMADRPLAVLIVSVIAVAALLVRWASWLFPAVDLAVWREVSTLATLVALCCVVLALVFRDGPITTRRIEGAIAVYLLLGFTWVQAYELVALWHPGAFAGAVDGSGSQSLTYYSFVTLTTVGYGDIVPVHPLARSRCWRRSPDSSISRSCWPGSCRWNYGPGRATDVWALAAARRGPRALGGGFVTAAPTGFGTSGVRPVGAPPPQLGERNPTARRRPPSQLHDFVDVKCARAVATALQRGMPVAHDAAMPLSDRTSGRWALIARGMDIERREADWSWTFPG